MNKGQLQKKKILRAKIVDHHLRYQYNGCSHVQEERKVPIYFTEHYITKLLQTRGRYVSKGFLLVLADFILDRLITGSYNDLSIECNHTIKKEQKGEEKK